MLVDSPDRVPQSSRSAVRSKPLASFGFQSHAFGCAAVKSSKGLRAVTEEFPSLVAQGKAKEEVVHSDLLWCDSYAPRQKVGLIL